MTPAQKKNAHKLVNKLQYLWGDSLAGPWWITKNSIRNAAGAHYDIFKRPEGSYGDSYWEANARYIVAISKHGDKIFELAHQGIDCNPAEVKRLQNQIKCHEIDIKQLTKKINSLHAELRTANRRAEILEKWLADHGAEFEERQV